MSDPTEQNRARLAAAYDAVPGHPRMYLLGDQDNKDTPLRTLLTPIGEKLETVYGPTDQVVTQEMHDVRGRISSRGAGNARLRRKCSGFSIPTDLRNSTAVLSGSTTSREVWLPRQRRGGAVRVRGRHVQDDRPCILGLSTDDARTRAQIVSALRVYEARRLGQAATRRKGWFEIRLAIMLGLLRAKFQQHPELAEQLIAAGTSRLINGVGFCSYWGTQRGDATG